MDELVVQLFLETLPYLYDAWQSGRVSRWHLVSSLAASVALPVLAVTISLPVVRALLWGGTALAWMAFLALVAVGCRHDEKSPGASPPRGRV